MYYQGSNSNQLDSLALTKIQKFLCNFTSNSSPEG